MGLEENQLIQPIIGNPGLIAEKLDPLVTSSATWKILQKINLEPFLRRGNILLEARRNLVDKCRQIKPDKICLHDSQLEQLHYRIKDTIKDGDRVIDLIKGHGFRESHRNKRAWVSAIGKLSRTLFGTLDEDAEQELKGLIEINANDTRQLSNLVANQTELICDEFGAAHAKAIELEKAIGKVQQEQETLMKQEVFNIAMEIFTDNVVQFEVNTETIVDAILFAAQGSIHLRFLPPEIITRSAELAKKTVTEALFPEPDSLAELLRASEIAIMLTQSHLVYCI